VATEKLSENFRFGKSAPNPIRAEPYKKELEQSLLVDGVLLTEERRDIVELSVKDLLNKLQDGTLSCVDVMKAYQAKALEVTKEFNCVTEFIKEAQVTIQCK
jgi:hypothetical protein